MEEKNNTTYEIQEVDNGLVEIQEDDNDRDFRMAIGIGIGILGTVLVNKGVSKIKNIINNRRKHDDEDPEDYDEVDEEVEVEVVDDSVKETSSK